MLIIAAIGLPVSKAQADTIISRSFDLPIPSPDEPSAPLGLGRMADAFIDVEQHFSIVDLDIAISLTHEAFMDLEMVLQGPDGTKITLNSALNDAFWIKAPGGAYSVGGENRFLFDDEAPLGIVDAVPPFDQAFRPKDGFKLSAFDGQDAFGRWCLQIYDAGDDNIGRLEAVELIITTPEPATALLLCLGVSLAPLLKSRKLHRPSR